MIGEEHWLLLTFCFCFSLYLFAGLFSLLNIWLVATLEPCELGYLCKVILYLLPLFCTYAMNISTRAFLFPLFLMDSMPNVRSWNILCWNIKGINAENKWEFLRNKILESNCDIIGIQETKRDVFDIAYIIKFCPRVFDSFCFLPSVGASDGILVVWKSSMFIGSENFHNNFAISVEFSFVHNNYS